MTYQPNAARLDPKNTESKARSVATGTSSTHISVNSHRLSNAEMAHRRELGLCYKCGERYSLTHTCGDKYLQVFLVDVELENGEGETEGAGEGTEHLFDANGTLNQMELSLNSIPRFGENRAMKVRGTIAKQKVVILIDSGATHNFITEELLKLPGIKVDEVPEYTITVRDGYTVKRRLRCRDVEVKIQGLNIIQTFYPFPLRGVDVVLGIDWL